MAALHTLGWQAALYRWPSRDERNPANHAETVASMNAIVAWREIPPVMRHVCWLWEARGLSQQELEGRLAKEKKEVA